MKTLIVGILTVFLSVGATNASAEIVADNEGKLHHLSVYQGPGFELGDFGFIGATLTGVTAAFFLEETAIPAWPALAFITWGAYRTNKYRPQVIKDLIAFNLEGRCGGLLPGTNGCVSKPEVN